MRPVIQFRLAAVLLLLVGALFVIRAAWAVTTFTGSVQASVTGVNTLSGNESGSSSFSASYQHNFSATATAPDIVGGGGYSGTLTTTTTGSLLNLANTTNIVISGGTGTIAPAQGYSLVGKRLRYLYLENLDATNTITVTVPAANGLAGLGWVATNTVAVLQPYGAATFTFPTGSTAFVTGTNDAITATASAATPTLKICVVAGS